MINESTKKDANYSSAPPFSFVSSISNKSRHSLESYLCYNLPMEKKEIKQEEGNEIWNSLIL